MGSHLCSGERGHVQDDVSPQVLAGVGHAVRQHQPAFSVRVVDFHSPGGGRDPTQGAIRWGTGSESPRSWVTLSRALVSVTPTGGGGRATTVPYSHAAPGSSAKAIGSIPPCRSPAGAGASHPAPCLSFLICKTGEQGCVGSIYSSRPQVNAEDDAPPFTGTLGTGARDWGTKDSSHKAGWTSSS